MAWNNQSGGPWSQGPNNQGPWGQGPRQQRPGGTPPDLEDIIRKGQDKLKDVLPGGGGRGMWLLILLALGVIWGLNSFYRVQPDEAGVVLRFGEYARTTGPGLNFAVWPIETVEKVPVGRENQLSFGNTDEESLMLAGDQNIVDIKFTVLWRIRDPEDFLFDVNTPELLTRLVAESAMREVVGRTPAEEIRTRGRLKVQEEVKALTQATLDRYKAGIQITSVQLEKADPPAQVIDAFEEVQRAEQNLNKFIREAERYRNRVLGEARGRSAQIIEQAKAYKAKVVAEAKGEAERFTQVLQQYRKAPDVTRKRLYIETMEKVLGKSGKIVLDTEKTGVLPYLPLDRLQQQSATAAPRARVMTPNTTTTTGGTQ